MKASTGEEITENSTPNLDDWGWDEFWSANDWMNWHKIMKAKKGKVYADSTFISWWDKQSFGTNMINARTYNTAFREFLKKEGLWGAVQNVISSPIGALVDLVSSGSNIASNIGSGAERASKVLRIAIPVLIVIAGVGLTIFAYKKLVK